jgi:hypothetical protein
MEGAANTGVINDQSTARTVSQRLGTYGKTLKNIRKERGPLPVTEAITYISDRLADGPF